MKNLSSQAIEIINNLLRKGHSPFDIKLAMEDGAYWDESGALENFVRSIEDWDEIAEFLIGIAEDKCKKWYDDNKDEATND